jgi:hypothetical protein
MSKGIESRVFESKWPDSEIEADQNEIAKPEVLLLTESNKWEIVVKQKGKTKELNAT